MANKWTKERFADLFAKYPYGWSRIRKGLGWTKEQMIQFGETEREFIQDLKDELLQDAHTTFWCMGVGKEPPEGFEKANPKLLEKILVTHSPVWKTARIAHDKAQVPEEAIDVSERRKLNEYLESRKAMTATVVEASGMSNDDDGDKG